MTVRTPAAPPGILDHIADGMSHVLARPVLIALPILLDLALVLSPVLSGKSLGERIATRLNDSEVGPFHQLGDWLGRQGEWDILRATALLMPSVADGLSSDAVYQPFAESVVRPGFAGGAALLIAATLVATLLLAGYETWLARATGMIEIDRSALARHIVRAWGAIAGFGLVALGVVGGLALLLVLPSLIQGGTVISGDTILGLTALVAAVLMLLTMFVPEAIVLDGHGPIGAIRASAEVVTGNFWSALGFFAVSLLISPGLLTIWERMADNPPGLIIAVLINAAMATSVAIASLAFYRARSGGNAPSK